MIIDWNDWPRLGRVGVARAKRCQGQRVFLVPDTVDESWLLFCGEPSDLFNFAGERFCFDNYPISDEFVNAAALAWDVEWMGGADEITTERRVFDVRGQVARTIAKKERHERRVNRIGRLLARAGTRLRTKEIPESLGQNGVP